MIDTDPFETNPALSQDYNRYSYVRNNPLKYTDPSGYLTGKHTYYGKYYQSASKWQNYINSRFGRNIIGIDEDPSLIDFYWYTIGGGAGGERSQIILGISAAGNGYESIIGDVIGNKVYIQNSNGTLISNDPSANMMQPSYSIKHGSFGYFINNGVTREPYEELSDSPVSEDCSFGQDSEFTYVFNWLFIQRYNTPETGYQGDFLGTPVVSTTKLLNNAAGVYIPFIGIFMDPGYTSNKFYLAHEWGHGAQSRIFGVEHFFHFFAIPSLITSNFSFHDNMPWETYANYYGWEALGMPEWWNNPYFKLPGE